MSCTALAAGWPRHRSPVTTPVTCRGSGSGLVLGLVLGLGVGRGRGRGREQGPGLGLGPVCSPLARSRSLPPRPARGPRPSPRCAASARAP
eukprot:scaffold124379_cov53-Phaeocystis_antarctica.AAC.1